MVVRCTAKALKLLGAKQSSLAQIEPGDDDWYVNLLWFERRKCLLLTHAGTVFSVFVPDVRKADLDATDGYPVRVVVEADPPTLLGPGPRRWDLAAPAGHVDLVAGAAGTGTLMIDVVASVCVDGECRIERSRRRHPLTVKPPTRRARTATAPQGMALEAGDPEPGSPEPDGPGTSP